MRLDSAIAYQRVGDIRQKLGRISEAEGAYQRGLDVLKQLSAEAPNDPEYQHERAALENNFGGMLVGLGRSAEAEELIRDSLAAKLLLADRFPDSQEYRLDTIRGLNSLAGVFQATSRLPDAEKYMRQALALQEQVVGQNPEGSKPPDARSNALVQLIDLHNNLAVVLRELGRHDEAERCLRRAIQIHEGAGAVHSATTRFRTVHARSLNGLAVLSATGRPAEAESLLRQAIDLHKSLAADAPDVVEHRIQLAFELHNLANFLVETGRAGQAAAFLDQAIMLWEAARARRPRGAGVP